MKRARQALSASVVLAGLLAWAGGRARAAEGAPIVTVGSHAAPVGFAATETAQPPRASEATEPETNSTTRVPRWQPHDFAFTNRSELDNPFQAPFSAEFTGPNRTKLVLPGFYDGNGTWKVRVSPTEESNWQLVTHSSVPALDGQRVQFVCTPHAPRVHGGVRKRVKPEVETGVVRVAGSSLLATKRVAVEEMKKAECAVVKLNGQEGESPSGLAESRRSLERKN